MLDYLSYLFDLGYEYRTVGCHRSAISGYHEYVDNKPVGQHPHVYALLSIHVLTYKLVILMALSSASRASTVHHLGVSYILRTEGKFVFIFHKLHKSWKYGKAPPSLEFCEYIEDRDLCVVTTLNEYIKHTYQRCTEKRRSQLLLSFIQPYVEVSSSAVSRWIKETLKLAGIDVSIFKGHSTRAASSSKTSKAGLSRADILARGSWSSSSTWQRFYNKQIMKENYLFRKTAFD